MGIFNIIPIGLLFIYFLLFDLFLNRVNPYKGVIDCMIKTIQKEGPFRLWVGLPIFYWRVAPHALMAKVV